MEACRECNGRRITVRIVPNVKRSNGVNYLSRITPTVERRFPCEACKGSGVEPDPVAPAERMWQVGAFEIDGHMVQAPGFERDQFVAFVDRAKAAQLRTTPATAPGTALVLSGSSDARYAVTRQTCGCRGHQQHGRCWHRAYAIWLVDVAGVDITTVPTIGISKRGLPLTTGRKVAS